MFSFAKFDKIAVCDGKSNLLYDIFTELGYNCIRVHPDAISATSAIVNSTLAAFAADTRVIETSELVRVFEFLRNIGHRILCFVLTSDPSAFDEFRFVRCCRRESEFKDLVEGHLFCSSKQEIHTEDSLKKPDKAAELERTVTEIIRNIGVPPNIKGYRYLRTAVMLAAEDITVLDSITKRLYPAIAKSNQTTPTRVERAIRHAITTAWEKQNGNSKAIEDILHCKISFDGERPTNSELIALISDSLRLTSCM